MSVNFDDIYAHLGQLEVLVGASESHGLLCGLLCTQPSTVAKTRWLTELLDAAAIDPAALGSVAADVRALDSWFMQELAALNDSELGFSPLLPADNTGLAERIRALGDFCAGFTYGIGLGSAGQGDRSFPDDSKEIIDDFNAIDSSATEDSTAADEDTYAELVEYVRVGVLLVHEELQPVIVQKSGQQKHIH